MIGTLVLLAALLDFGPERELVAASDSGSLVVWSQFLLLWTTEDVEYVLLSEDLAEVDRGAVPIPPAHFSLATTGTRPVLGYSRVAEEHGRVLRAFVRTTAVPRNRAVRR